MVAAVAEVAAVPFPWVLLPQLPSYQTESQTSQACVLPPSSLLRVPQLY